MAVAPEQEARIVARRRAVGAVWIALMLGSLAVLCALGPVGDTDLGWHLAAGRWIAAHHAMPWIDPFAQSARPWFEYSWLFDLIVNALEQAWALRGIVAYRVGMALLIVAALWRLARAAGGDARAAFIAVVLALAALHPALTERSYLFTVLFLALTLNAVMRARAGAWRDALPLPLAYAIWANTHVEFVYGVPILALACGAPILDALLERDLGALAEAARPRTRAWWQLIGLSAACTVATLINPGGLRVWQIVFLYAGKLVPYRYILELRPPDFSMWNDRITALMVIAAVAALIARKQRSTFEPLVLLFAAAISLRSERDSWFAALPAVAILGAAPMPELRRGRALLVPLQLASAFAALLVVYAAVSSESEASLEAQLAREAPVRAVELIEREQLEGPLFNDFDWGGYLIWKLPRLKVSIDGRTPLYPDDEFERSVLTWRGDATPSDEDPALARAKLIVAQRRAGLTEKLRADPAWKIAHEDDVAVVFTRAR